MTEGELSYTEREIVVQRDHWKVMAGEMETLGDLIAQLQFRDRRTALFANVMNGHENLIQTMQATCQEAAAVMGNYARVLDITLMVYDENQQAARRAVAELHDLLATRRGTP